MQQVKLAGIKYHPWEIGLQEIGLGSFWGLPSEFSLSGASYQDRACKDYKIDGQRDLCWLEVEEDYIEEEGPEDSCFGNRGCD